MDVQAWVDRYGEAWRSGDADAVVALFTDDAVYRSSVFREPHVGAAEIRAYWAGATSTQSELDLRFGRPFVDGDTALVEWWAVLRDEGEQITLPGCLIVRFAPDGRCSELREYWHVERGKHEPPSGWGR